MLSSPRARFAYVLSLLAASPVVLGLAFAVLRQAIAAGRPEAWMMGGVLAIVVGLPLAMVFLAVAGWAQRRIRSWSIVPNVGENVPGVGQ